MNLSGLRKALASLPRTLNGTYERILCNIDQDHYRYALRILQWLTYSARPLTLAAVAEIVAIDVEESPRFNPSNRFPEPRDILTICAGLISLGEDTLDDGDNHGRVVRLARFSVKEYLVSNAILQGEAKHYSIQEINANVSISNDCIAYLLSFDGLQSLTSHLIAEFPLAWYAARYWVQHARVAERDTNSNPSLAIELFLTSGNALLNWVRLWDPDQPRSGLDLKRSLSTICHPLYYASSVGLYKLVRILLNKGADVNAPGGLYHNALQAASAGGYSRVVSELLENGADINASGRNFGNALQAASLKGHDHVVQMLLEKGADVNASGGRYGNALQAASIGGHTHVVQMLLEKGADVNASGGRFGNALRAALFGDTTQAAWSKGHVHVMKMLLQKGADVNALSENDRNTLQSALSTGFDEEI